MAQIRQENAELPADGIFLQAEGGGYRLWTFAGGRANNLLAKVLESVLGEKVTTSNLYLRLRGQAGASEVAIRQALDTLREQNRPNQDDSFRFAESCARGRLSKFEPCLPDRLAAAYMADVLTDAAGAADVLRAR